MADGQQSQMQKAGESFAPVDRVLAALPQLSHKRKRKARCVLINQGSVAVASAGDAGVRTRSSAATVVCSCQALGCQGHIQLQTRPFLVVTDPAAHSLSPVATVSLLNAFTAAPLLEMPEQVVDCLRRVDGA